MAVVMLISSTRTRLAGERLNSNLISGDHGMLKSVFSGPKHASIVGGYR